MAKSKNNVITHGLSGLIGDLLVFRQRANKTIVADRPKPFSTPPTDLQLGIQRRFKRAAQYARKAIGEEISLNVIDDFQVIGVKVKIMNADLSLLEEGDAVQSDNGLDWIYTSTAVNAAPCPCRSLIV